MDILSIDLRYDGDITRLELGDLLVTIAPYIRGGMTEGTETIPDVDRNDVEVKWSIEVREEDCM